MVSSSTDGWPMDGHKPITLALFGGSGGTGQQVIARAKELGTRVQALARKETCLKMAVGDAEWIPGSLLDGAALDRTLEGANAASLVFGPRPPYTDVFCAAATTAILEAMGRRGIRRIVCQTGAMVGECPRNRSLPFDLLKWLYSWRVPEGTRDRAEQERMVMESGLEWTLVKPPRLTNGPRSRGFRVGPHLRVGLLSSVSRADVAAFILGEILTPRFIREAVFLAS